MATLALDIGVGVTISVEQSTKTHILLVEEIILADGYPIEFGAVGKLFMELRLEVSIYL